MEKLLKYLNEWQEEKEKNGPKLARYTQYDSMNKVFYLDNGASFCQEFVLSRRFGFINWLFKKDKINKKKNGYTVFGDANPTNQGGPEFSAYSDLESLLMILAIYEPLDILIPILK